MKYLAFVLLFLASNLFADEVLSLRFAYMFEQPDTKPLEFEGQTWYVSDYKGLFPEDFGIIELLETTDSFQPVKLKITLKPKSHEAHTQAILQDGAFPGLVVMSNGEAVGAFPVLHRNPPLALVLPIRDAETNRAIYELVK